MEEDTGTVAVVVERGSHFLQKSLASIKTVNLCFVFSGYFRYKTVDLDHDHARLLVRV